MASSPRCILCGERFTVKASDLRDTCDSCELVDNLNWARIPVRFDDYGYETVRPITVKGVKLA